MNTQRKNDFIGSVLLLSTAVIWGLAFSMQELAAVMPPFTLIMLRSLVAVIFLVPVMLLFDYLGQKNGISRRLFSVREGKLCFDIHWREWRGGAISGVLLCFATVLQQIGIGETGAGKTGFITSLYMVIVPILGLLFGRRIGKQNAVAVVIAVFGFFLISMGDFTAPAVSDLFVLACAFVFAAQILAIARFSEGCDGVRFSFVQFLTCFAVSLPVSLFFEKPQFEANGASLLMTTLSVIGPILFLGTLSSGVAYTTQVLGQQRMSSQTAASVLMSLENVFAALFAAVIFPERRMTPTEIIGCVTVFLAVLLTQIPLEQKKKKAEDAPLDTEKAEDEKAEENAP